MVARRQGRRRSTRLVWNVRGVSTWLPAHLLSTEFHRDRFTGRPAEHVERTAADARANTRQRWTRRRRHSPSQPRWRCTMFGRPGLKLLLKRRCSSSGVARSGLLIASVSAAVGGDVSVSEPNAQRRQLIDRIGSAHGRPGRRSGHRRRRLDEWARCVDVSFEVSGSPGGVEAAVASLAARGRLHPRRNPLSRPTPVDLFKFFWRRADARWRAGLRARGLRRGAAIAR